MTHWETHPSVVCTVLDDGGVLLHLDTRYYYSLNPMGLAVWTLLEDGHADPAGVLAGWFPDVAGRGPALEAFLNDLEREHLVRPAPNGSAGASPPAAAAGIPDSWSEPRLIRHDIPLNQIMSNPFDPSVPLAE